MSDKQPNIPFGGISSHRAELLHSVVSHRNNTPSRTARKGGDDENSGGVNGNGTGIYC